MEIIKIGELIETQDNRLTDQPIFIVERRRRAGGYDSEYSDDYVWFHPESGDLSPDDAEQWEKLESLHENFEDLGDWRRVYYKDHWEFVTACFTEQGCKDFIAKDGHNLGKTRVYAVGSYRNEEFRTVRNMLIRAAKVSRLEG